MTTMFNIIIPPRRGVVDTTLSDKVLQWLAPGRWFSPSTPVSSTNKTDCHDIAKKLLKVALKYYNPLPLNTNINTSLDRVIIVCFNGTFLRWQTTLFWFLVLLLLCVYSCTYISLRTENAFPLSSAEDVFSRMFLCRLNKDVRLVFSPGLYLG